MKSTKSNWATERDVDSHLKCCSLGEDTERSSLTSVTQNPSSDLPSLLNSGIHTLGKDESKFRNSVERLAELQERLTKGMFHLAVLGQFKRGKSTLLNALVGEEITPCAVIPLTSIPTLVRYSETKQVSITYMDGHFQAITSGEIADYVTEERNPHNRKKVRQVEVEHPALLLSKGIVLIDTPGVGSTFTHNSRTTLEFLPHCDAALFLISPDPPVTEAEVTFLRAVRKQVDHLFFVLNKSDYLNHDEQSQLIEFFCKVLREQLGLENPVHLFTVSARQGLQARLTNDAALWQASGMAEMECYLINFAAQEKTKLLHRAIAKKTRDIGLEVNLQIDLERRSLELPLEDLDQKIETFQKKIMDISKQRQETADVLSGDQRRISQMIEDRANAAGEHVHGQMKSWMQDFFSPDRDQGDFKETETRFHQQIGKFLPATFGQEAGLFFAELRKLVQQALENQLSRSHALFAEVQKAAAEIFQIPYHPIDLDASLPQLKDVYWETKAWSGLIGAIPIHFYARLMPQGMRIRKLQATLGEEADRLVAQNIENLRWNAIRQVDETFRSFTREIDAQFQALIEGTRGAMEAASRNRRENAASVQELIVKLLQFGESMRVWTEQLDALLSTKSEN